MRFSFLALLALLAGPALAIADDCPPAHFASTSIPAEDFSKAALDTGLVGGVESVTVHFDRSVSQAFLRRVSALGGGGSSLDVVDEFTVGRLPFGTPVVLDAKLSAYGNAPPSGKSGPSWTVTLGSDADSVIGVKNYEDWSQELTLHLNVIAGTPFRVHYRMQVLGGFDSFEQNEGATLTFENFPPGAVISSCHGYLQGTLPIQPATWGSLKARYR